MDEWISKMWYILKMEWYSALKRKGIRPYATTWVNLEDTEQNKPVTKRQILYNSTYMRYVESRENHRYRK